MCYTVITTVGCATIAYCAKYIHVDFYVYIQYSLILCVTIRMGCRYVITTRVEQTLMTDVVWILIAVCIIVIAGIWVALMDDSSQW